MTYAHDAGPAGRTGRPGEGMEAVASVFSGAAHQGATVFNTGLRLWEDEATRYVDELTDQGRKTLDQLCGCRTPLDVMSVEQDWIRARSRFYMEAGLRFAGAFAAAAQDADGGGRERPDPAGRPREDRI